MESESSHREAADAAAQLAALQADRKRLAERVQSPWWYDPALGFLVFLMFGSVSSDNGWVVGAALVVFVAGLALLKRQYIRATGIWIGGWRPGRMRRATWVWTVLSVLVVPVSVWLEQGAHVRGAMLVGGFVLGVGIAVISRWWTRLYVEHLREGR